MSEIFLDIVNMSIAASWLIAITIVLRFILKKAPKWLMPVLWGVTGLRLVMPVTLVSRLSLVPSAKTLPKEMLQGDSFDVYSGVPAIDDPVNSYLGSREVEAVSEKVTGQIHPMTILGFLWVIGICGMFFYALITYFRLKNKVGTSIKYEGNIRFSDRIDSPFILGIIRPMIYLPLGIKEQDEAYVLAHEKAHLKRLDHIWKPLSFLLLSIYWFNPLVWAAYIFLCKDIELACDEKVVAGYDMEQKKAYATALLDCSMYRRMVMVCPLAFGEVGVKERVKSVLNHRKPAFWIIMASISVCIVTGFCFLTNPPQREFDVRIVIPAGSDYGCYTSEEEVKSGFGGITLAGAQESTHMLAKGKREEVVLVPSESYGSDSDPDLTVYSTTTFPATFDTPGKNWYRVGVNTDNPTNEDIILHIKVQNVTVRIETMNLKKEGDLAEDIKKGVETSSLDDFESDDISVKSDIEDTGSKSVKDWLSIELPQGYSISNFDDNIGYDGGSLILPESYDVYKADDSGFSPPEWRYSGLITRIPARQTNVVFKRGLPDLSGIPKQNHSTQEYIDVIGLERSTNQWPAILLKVNYDLYTPSQIYDLQEKGITIDDADTTSNYWEFWFVKQGEETYYVVTLSMKEFSRKEAERIARTVTIK